MQRWVIGLVGLFLSLNIAFANEPIQLVTEEFPPYQQLQKGRDLSGWSVDIVQQIFEEAGLAQHTQVLPWPRALRMALEQPNLFIFSLLQTEERLAKFQWVAPLCPMRVSFYTSLSRNEVAPNNLDEAKAFIVGVEQGHANFKFLLKNGFVEAKNLVQVGQNHQLQQMLNLKRVDLILLSDAYVEQQRVKSPEKMQLRKLFSVPALERMLYLATHPQTSPGLVDKIRQAAARVYQKQLPSCQLVADGVDPIP